MFTFGIFTTHIPYLIFLGFYLSYFLCSYCSKSEQDELTELKKEISYEAPDCWEGENALYIEFVNHQSPQIAAVTLISKAFFLVEQNNLPHRASYAQVVFVPALSGMIVSRPPPQVV